MDAYHSMLRGTPPPAAGPSDAQTPAMRLDARLIWPSTRGRLCVAFVASNPPEHIATQPWLRSRLRTQRPAK
jgi:hypothetical protein